MRASIITIIIPIIIIIISLCQAQMYVNSHNNNCETRANLTRCIVRPCWKHELDGWLLILFKTIV